jgi:DNA-binding MarR family transcriptional regulator
MEEIKHAFSKVKQDIDFLKKESEENKQKIQDINQNLIEICEIMRKLDQKLSNKTPTHNPENKVDSTHNTTHNSVFKALKPQNMPISTGNQGVPTDRQTDRQTDKYPQKSPKTAENTPIFPNQAQNPKNSFEDVTQVLEKLDNIKKEIRLKFKRLTEKEILVFSTLYQIEEEQGKPNYKVIAEKLNLTESSIRDYIGRLIKKGIPVEKNKINNKIIELSISKHLKEIASLSTILQLRDL